MASLLIAVIFSLLTLLTVLRLLFDFSRREQDVIKLLSLPTLGGTMIIKTTRSKPAKTQMIRDKTRMDFSVVGQLLKFVAREVMEGEYERIYGLREFSIRIGVVVWTGENDTETNVDANLFENGTKQYRFRLKTV